MARCDLAKESTGETCQRTHYRYSLGLWLFYLVTYIIPLGWRPLLAPDETRYAQIGSLLQRSGDLIVPHYLGMRYFEKPILAYWLNGAAQWLLGSSNFSARLGCAIAAGLSGLMVYAMARLLWRDVRRAACCTLVYLSMFMVFGTGTYISIDAPMTLWVALMMLCIVWAYTQHTAHARFWGYVGVGVASGAGVMTKGFLALALPVLTLTPWLLLTKRWRHLCLYAPLAIIVAVITVLPWGIAIQLRDPEFWPFFFWHEHIQRFFSQTEAQHAQPFHFFIPVLIAGIFPWWGIALRLKSGLTIMSTATRRYLLLWVMMPLIFFSCANGKLAPYILPCFPALGLLLGATLDQLVQHRRERALRWTGIWVAVSVLVGLTVLVSRGQRDFDLSVDLLAYSVTIVTLVCMAGIGLIVAFKPRWVVLLALVPTLLAWGVPFCLPEERIYDKAPAVFATEHAELLRSSSVLASNQLSDSAAISWVTGRDDIVIYETVGELEFDLQHHPERWVSKEGLPAWLQRMRHCGRVTMMLDNGHDSFEPAMQLRPDSVVTHGSYSMLSYAALPTSQPPADCPAAAP